MLQRFFESFHTAFRDGLLLKCTLSKPTQSAAEGLKNIFLRPVMLKSGPRVAFNFRYKTRDEVKNFTLEEALEQLTQLLGQAFLQADLLTTERDTTLSFNKEGVPHLLSRNPSHTAPADTAHDRAKHRLLNPAAPWLHLLGITNAKGEVLPTAQDKWKQINKYLEIVENLLKDQYSEPLTAVHIADMGSGKGYLTFALYDFLQNKRNLTPHITGIELRKNLVDFCNKTAQAVGFENLQFVATDINDFHPEHLDMLIALHACDTATDLAIAAGIRQHAPIVMVAPCCHKQIRRDMDAHNELAPLLRHGILEERQAEILTDGIRALLLEASGYRTQVFEFISTEHTAKNVMITAMKSGKQETGSGKRQQTALDKVAAIKASFGIREHYLERLLPES